jgi:predicted RNA-binding protein (virulence factor B family)
VNPATPSVFDALLGQRTALVVQRLTSSGALLGQSADTSGSQPSLTLPRAEVPEHTRVGDEVTVFVYLDSAAKLMATTRDVKLVVGQVTFLTITACTDVGAFADWGLPKELLVPFAEQSSELAVGQRHPIGLYVDKSGRLSGTMRVSPLLSAGELQVAQDQWIDGEAWRNDPEIGLFVILKKTCVGLVPRHEPHTLSRGDAARFRVTHVLPDAKISLSLRALAHEQLDLDAERVLALLKRPNPPKLGDHSPPEQVRQLLGLSKKAFKRAVGSLLRQRRVQMDDEGHLTLV